MNLILKPQATNGIFVINHSLRAYCKKNHSLIMANLFVPDQYNLWIHLLTAVVRPSWNHRGLGDRGKAGLTVTHLLSQIPL